MKTNDLMGATLDWAVAKCEGMDYLSAHQDGLAVEYFSYSTEWSRGGPIIEGEKIEICPVGNGEWRAQLFGQGDLHRHYGPTPLIAAMRCYVASKMGDTVEVPPDLT